jgi:RHH-type proline utilization regulon transcriptional repressor/proline dehydrogenase/delta 1-pyrroline-5-carboxylate dehydrogenase
MATTINDAKRRPLAPSRDEVAAYHLIDERRLMSGLLERATVKDDERHRIADVAQQLVNGARANRHKHSGIDAFMHEYGLTNEEGVILMCIAEALLRIPDADTADALIAEKVASGHWEKHLGASESLFVNASTWGLMLTGRIVKHRDGEGSGVTGVLKRLVARSGEPLIRQAVRQAVKILGDQFVLGRTIKEALSRARSLEAEGYRLSYDMLGEAAKTDDDARSYHTRYLEAIEAVGKSAGKQVGEDAAALLARPGISIKLSALDPRFEPGREERLERTLAPRLLEVARVARARGVSVTIDAEEQDRLDLTLGMLARTVLDPALDGWSGLGIAVQAYSRRSLQVLRWLKRLAAQSSRRIPVRLVKGAYWDSEIKWAQERGLSDYPVYTRKLHTDVSWLAAMRYLLAEPGHFYPQLATHNAYSIAAAHVVGGDAAFEFQRLHGMGEALYAEVMGKSKLRHSCRIYAPVGSHDQLLAYLVRRLLENGANTSFVNRLADDEAPVADIIGDPVDQVRAELATPRDHGVRVIPLPGDLHLPQRRNSVGLALSEPAVREALYAEMAAELRPAYEVGAIVDGNELAGREVGEAILSPHDRREQLGTVHAAVPADIERAIVAANRGLADWDRLGGDKRAEVLEQAAEYMERDRARLMTAMVREAGKTLEAAQGDVREAVDYLRYYAAEARRLFSGPTLLRGPTGERNTLELRARGPLACISPWNFPLAIFVGQVAAALAAGNTVLAKPAEQTPILGFMAAQILLEAGVPREALHLLPGGGAVGAALTRDPRIKGVVFTGSNDTAWAIQKALTERRGAIVPLIAETGGINAMIADSTALPEQVVRDAVRSAYDSAGQRCSAARVLFLQDEIADTVIEMLVGSVRTLQIGDPYDYATDIGPVIDEAARDALETHKLRMRREAKELVDLAIPEDCRHGTYVGPAAYEIERMSALEREVFGPILHIVRFERGHLDKVCDAINASGFGLTLGLHSRIASVAALVTERVRVGNLYVNRNQIGAVVGVQPFGGEGLSGTGPKAGGPNYLLRLAVERVRSVDITATGGNVQLLGLGPGSGEVESG